MEFEINHKINHLFTMFIFYLQKTTKDFRNALNQLHHTKEGFCGHQRNNDGFEFQTNEISKLNTDN